jgi:hypothetical protein
VIEKLYIIAVTEKRKDLEKCSLLTKYPLANGPNRIGGSLM